MANTPIFKFRLVAENTTESGKAASANENALIAEALFKQRVESRSTAAPPGSPSDGQVYIVPDATASPAPSGAWAGHEDEIAIYYNGWLFVEPVNGPVFYVADEDLNVKYDDTASPPAWIVGGSDTFLGLSDTPTSYSGQAGQAVLVNGGETGLEFGAPTADPDTLLADTTDELQVGFSSAVHAAGTKSSGTFTPDEADGAMQSFTNGGAFTLAPPVNNCSLLLQGTNNASAGTITTSGFTVVNGDSLTTTDGDDFLFYISKIGSFSHLHVVALQ